MKIRYYKNNFVDWFKIIGSTILVGGVLIAGCSSANRTKVPEINKGESNTNYDIGSHMIIDIDRRVVPISESKRFSLSSPEGYKIVDFDYDRWQLFEFYDVVYVNDEEVYVVSPDQLGNPVNPGTDSDSLGVGEHVIVDIKKQVALFGQDDTSFCLEAPIGYTVLDYDYDKTDAVEFENVTYTNIVPVSCTDIDDFGIPNDDIDINSHPDGVYDVGEHKIVVINKESNPWWGKDEMKQIVAPKGYKIVDYDYDKTDYSEYETITYENIVPVVARNKDTFGVPMEDVKDNQSGIGEYEPYTHVLVRIDRNMNFWVGEDGSRQLVAPDGYELLDYDYDINDDFEFETYVYVNNKRIYLEDTTNFGVVIEKDAKKKILVP